MLQKQIGSISEIELRQAGILQLKMTFKLNGKMVLCLNPIILDHFLLNKWEKNLK